MTTCLANANGIKIAYRLQGKGPPLALIMGYRLNSIDSDENEVSFNRLLFRWRAVAAVRLDFRRWANEKPNLLHDANRFS